MAIRSLALPPPSGILVWIGATRPQFLTTTVLAILLGTATATYEDYSLNVLTLLLSLIAGIAAHAGANVLNDYYDDLSGADGCNTRPLTPFAGGSRVIQQNLMTPAQVLGLAKALFAVAGLLGLLLAAMVGPLLLMIGGLGILLGIAYSAPLVALSYRGLGEVTIAMTFGILPVVGAHYVQAGVLSPLPVYIGIIPGLLTAAILYINQFPDYWPDRPGRKTYDRSPIVAAPCSSTVSGLGGLRRSCAHHAGSYRPDSCRIALCTARGLGG